MTDPALLSIATSTPARSLDREAWIDAADRLTPIEVDRKVLADLAVHEPEAFNAIAERARTAAAA